MIARAIPYHGMINYNTHYQDGDPQKIMCDTKVSPGFSYVSVHRPLCRYSENGQLL